MAQWVWRIQCTQYLLARWHISTCNTFSSFILFLFWIDRIPWQSTSLRHKTTQNKITSTLYVIDLNCLELYFCSFVVCSLCRFLCLLWYLFPFYMSTRQLSRRGTQCILRIVGIVSNSKFEVVWITKQRESRPALGGCSFCTLIFCLFLFPIRVVYSCFVVGAQCSTM